MSSQNQENDIMNADDIIKDSQFARYVNIRERQFTAVVQDHTPSVKLVTCYLKDINSLLQPGLKTFEDYIFIEGESCLITDFYPIDDDFIRIRVVEGLKGK